MVEMVSKWEIYRFHGQVGKPYRQGKKIETLTETEHLKLKIKQQETEIAVLKKYKDLYFESL